MASNNTILYAGGALLLLLLFSGKAKAASPAPDLPLDNPDEPVDDNPQPQPPQLPPPDNSNWGGTPPALIEKFSAAEVAAGIPGLGRFMAVWAWGAFRAGQAYVSPEQAAQIAANNPDLCRTCHNLTASEKQASRKALENVALPKGEKGQYGEGKYDPPWPMPAQFDQWADFGSAGLFDILAGSHAHSGIHDSKFSPLISHPPTILYQIDVQLFIAGYMTYRIIKSPNYKVLKAGDPKTTWTNVRRVTANPSAFQANNQYSKDVGDRFQARAIELGIDLDLLEYPWPMSWPGAKSYFEKLGVSL